MSPTTKISQFRKGMLLRITQGTVSYLMVVKDIMCITETHVYWGTSYTDTHAVMILTGFFRSDVRIVYGSTDWYLWMEKIEIVASEKFRFRNYVRCFFNNIEID